MTESMRMLADSGHSPYYWGSHLDERSRQPTSSRPEWRPQFSIQRLAPEGGPTEDIAYFDDAAQRIILDGQEVPNEAMATIVTLQVGTGVYLSREGVPVEPF